MNQIEGIVEQEDFDIDSGKNIIFVSYFRENDEFPKPDQAVVVIEESEYRLMQSEIKRLKKDS